MLFTIFSNLYIAAIGELKVFFIELIIIAAGIVFFSKPSKKIILISATCIIGLYGGIQLFYNIFPSWQNYFTLSTMIASNQNYATTTDLGRLTAAKTIASMFFGNDIIKYLFGLGLGSAETSQYAVFTSYFYYEYGSLLHYTWLSDAFMLIENGWLGLICFIGFFVSVIGSCFKIRKNNSEGFYYCIMAQVFAVVCCVFAVYNNTFRTEAGYLVYFMLSLPFAIKSEDLFSKLKGGV